MAQEWSEVVATTISQFNKGAVDLTIREHPVFATLQQKGRFKFGDSGLSLTWQNKFGEPDVETYSGGAIGYAPTDKHRRLEIDWRGYKMSDLMTEKETLMNRGPQALIRRYSETFDDMKNTMRRRLATELYNDGATNSDRFHGIETFCTAGGSIVAGDKIARATGSYAGHSCVPGTIAGSWSTALTTKPSTELATDWPEGVGDPEYEWHTPLLVNWSSTAWGTGSTAWIDNCERAMRYANLYMTKGGGKEHRIDMFLMTIAMYNDFMNRASTLRKIDVPAKRLMEMGFEGFMLDGVELTKEYGVPANTCYALNHEKLELRCMYDQLWITKGPEWDMYQAAWLFLLLTWGNWRFMSPQFFGKLYNYA